MKDLKNHEKAEKQATVMGSAIKVGDFIRGSWRDNATGKTFYTEGTVMESPSGLFVQEEENGGITSLGLFFHFSEVRHCP